MSDRDNSLAKYFFKKMVHFLFLIKFEVKLKRNVKIPKVRQMIFQYKAKIKLVRFVPRPRGGNSDSRIHICGQTFIFECIFKFWLLRSFSFLEQLLKILHIFHFEIRKNSFLDGKIFC